MDLRCNNCGWLNSSNYSFCEKCGFELKPLMDLTSNIGQVNYKCKYCGNITEQKYFCNICGGNDLNTFEIGNKSLYRCSCCSFKMESSVKLKFCPNCGNMFNQNPNNGFDFDSKLKEQQEKSDFCKNQYEIIIENKFYRNINESIDNVLLQNLENIKLARDLSTGLFGLVSINGKVLVDFRYDSISPFTYTCYPGPGPCPPRERWFWGAFFQEKNNVGFIVINTDGSLTETGKIPQEHFDWLSRLT